MCDHAEFQITSQTPPTRPYAMEWRGQHDMFSCTTVNGNTTMYVQIGPGVHPLYFDWVHAAVAQSVLRLAKAWTTERLEFESR
jgi:hypothetical protein